VASESPTNTVELLKTMDFANHRLTREWATVKAMLSIYCRDQHGSTGLLCADCDALKSYARLRLERCRFGEDKPTCAKCPVHCYQKSRRDEIRAVMRYSGPRMLWKHPWLSLWHLLDGWCRRVPQVERANPTHST
jgi:hypothetical protein